MAPHVSQVLAWFGGYFAASPEPEVHMNEMNQVETSEPGAEPQALEGASFSPLLKGLATVMVVTLVAGTWRALTLGAWQQLDGQSLGVIGFLALLILAGYWGILTSRTRIDGIGIRQTWLWEKRVKLAEITQLKLIHVHGLSWLIAPRLVVRTQGIGVTTFHVADPKLLEACRKLAYG